MSDEKKKTLQVSKAPPPITPIRGTGSATPRATVKVPDWDLWRHMPRAEVRQVCALSLNIDPDSLERGGYGQWLGFPSEEVAALFDKRVRLYSTITKTPAHGEIKLSDFAVWAVSEMKWSDLPKELVAIAQQHMPTPTPQPLPMISAPEWSALVQQDEEAKQDPTYKAEHDRVRSLYEERDALLALPFKGEKTIKRLGEISDELFKTEHPQNSLPKETRPIQDEQEILKSSALVREFRGIWPSIERDLRDKTRHANSLLHEANTKHGYYEVENALRWAKMEGKITKQSAEAYTRTAANSVFSSMIEQIYKLS